MRRISQKRQGQIMAAADTRTAFALEFPLCWVCGRAGTDTHEIARGAARAVSYSERCNWLRLCRPCHQLMDDAVQWPAVRQYALKALWDPDHYSRTDINRLRGRAPEAVTAYEVRCALCTVLRDFNQDLLLCR